MEPLQIICDHDTEPTGYAERKTAKAVIVGDDGRTMMFSSTLLGGGVEGDETFEEALHREIMEEAGAEVEIVQPLGTIIGYRDDTAQRYVIEGFLCQYVRTASAPTSADINELELEVTWQDPREVAAQLQKEIEAFKNTPAEERDPNHQSRIHNRRIALRFIQEALKSM